MKMWSLFLIGFLALAGCVNTIDGSIEVLQLFSAKISDPNCNPGRGGSCPVRHLQVAPGNYNAKLRVQGERQVSLEISLNGTPNTIPIWFPNRIRFPEYEGQIKVLGSEIDQAFDIEVTLNSQFRNGDRIQDVESCVETVYELRCYQTPEGYSNCTTVAVQYPAEQEVEYYIEYIAKSLRSKLLKAGTEDVIANLSGTQNLENRHYTYIGECSRFRRRR